MRREVKLFLFDVVGMIVCLLLAAPANAQDPSKRAQNILDAIYGNLEKTHEEGTVEVVDGVVTLTGSTWPKWARYSKLGTDKIATRDSDTQLTLDDLTVQTVAGSAYVLNKIAPPNQMQIEQIEAYVWSGYTGLSWPGFLADKGYALDPAKPEKRKRIGTLDEEGIFTVVNGPKKKNLMAGYMIRVLRREGKLKIQTAEFTAGVVLDEDVGKTEEERLAARNARIEKKAADVGGEDGMDEEIE